MKKIALLAIVAMTLSVVALGCRSERGRWDGRRTMMMEQTMCPRDMKPIDKKYHSMHEGRAVYFCSKDCKEAFHKMSAEEKAEMMKKMDMQMMEQHKKMMEQGGMMGEEKPMMGGGMMQGEQK